MTVKQLKNLQRIMELIVAAIKHGGENFNLDCLEDDINELFEEMIGSKNIIN